MNLLYFYLVSYVTKEKTKEERLNYLLTVTELEFKVRMSSAKAILDQYTVLIL